jgi:hypothetical protein
MSRGKIHPAHFFLLARVAPFRSRQPPGGGHHSSLAVGTVSAHSRVTLAEVAMFDQLLVMGVLLFFYGIFVGTA